ncbi:MAG: noncanonical pyrimidine nucleotidase, YjjG family [Chitinophagia bacterium]|nr:noncanonical pyrimidine nucleotidase, YjjG family [Chitinophagia bacterium]
MARQYQHLFFDLDHTLWDFDKNSEATMRALFQEFELHKLGMDNFEKAFASFNTHNDRLWERYRSGLIKRDELRWKRMWLMLLDHKIGDTTLAHELSIAYLELLPVQKLLLPSAVELLDHCKGRYQLHLITNGFETTQRMKLQYSGIARYFNHLITSEKSNSLKPHRGIFDFALELAGATTENSLMIGDALEIDVVGAMNAGWDAVYFNPHKKPHERQPTYEVHHLQELVPLL